MAGKHRLEYIEAKVLFFRLDDPIEVHLRSIEVYPIRASWVKVTSEIHVPLSGNPVVSEAPNRCRGIHIEQDVVVPRLPVGVYKDGGIRKVVIVVDDIS